MAVHVGETFLENAEKDEFTIAGRAVHFLGDIAIDVDSAALGETFDEPAGGRGDASFVEQGRVKQVRRGANFLQSSVGQGVEVVDEEMKIGACGVRLMDKGDGHFHGGEGLSGGVVELTGNAASFFVLQGHEANGELAELLLGLLAHTDLGFETSQGLREFVSTLVDTALEFVVSLAELLFRALALVRLGGESDESIGEPEVLAPEGVAKDGENRTDEKGTDDIVHLVLANELDGVAGIDEPVEDAAESEESAENGGDKAADDRAECNGDVERNVERDVAQHGVEKPAKQDRGRGGGDCNRITCGDSRTREWRENGQRARWGGTVHTASMVEGSCEPRVILKMKYRKLWTLNLKMQGARRKLSGASRKTTNGR